MVSKRKNILQGTAILSLGEGVSYGCSLIRNIILARILTKADFGVAATFAIMVSMLDLTRKIGINQVVIQAKEGNTPEFNATTHFVQAILGALSAALLFLLGQPMAHLFGVPEASGTFQMLPLIPLLGGFQHLDSQRMVRELHFVPSVLIYTLPQIGITIIAWPIAVWFNDYRALLCLLIIKCSITMIASHLVAKCPYSWNLSKSHLRCIYFFGWPVLINGFLLLAIQQGDQIIVGVAYSMADLGTYSVAMSLSLVPLMIFLGVLSSIILPILSPLQDFPELFRQKYVLCIQALGAFAILLSTVLIVSGENLIVLLFGAKYAGTGALIGWLGAAQGVRLLRAGSALAAIAKGDTKNQLISNLVRLSSIPMALFIATNGGELFLVAAALFAGETASFFTSVIRLSVKQGVPVFETFRSGAFLLASFALSGMLAGFMAPHTENLAMVLVSLLLGLTVACGLIMSCFSEIRAEIFTFIRYSVDRFCLRTVE